MSYENKILGSTIFACVVFFFLGLLFGHMIALPKKELVIEKPKTEIKNSKIISFKKLKEELDFIYLRPEADMRTKNQHLAHVLYIMLDELEVQQRQIHQLDSLR